MSSAMHFVLCLSVGAVFTTLAFVGEHLRNPQKWHGPFLLFLIPPFLLWGVFSTIAYIGLSEAHWQLSGWAMLGALGGSLAFVTVGAAWAVCVREMEKGGKLNLAAFRKFNVFGFVLLWAFFSAALYHQFL